jgi:hypothetical protein
LAAESMSARMVDVCSGACCMAMYWHNAGDGICAYRYACTMYKSPTALELTPVTARAC